MEITKAVYKIVLVLVQFNVQFSEEAERFDQNQRLDHIKARAQVPDIGSNEPGWLQKP
jgi:hypothetical protein